MIDGDDGLLAKEFGMTNEFVVTHRVWKTKEV